MYKGMKKYLLVLILFAVSSVFIFSFFAYTTYFARNKKNSMAVVIKMRELSRLETSSFTVEKIISVGEPEKPSIRDFLFGDKILLIAQGEVIAGFDLSKINEDSIVVDGNKLVINLPDSEILASYLHNEGTRVYDRETGIFTSPNKDLEKEAREEAEKAILEAACNSGILEQAKENGAKQIRTMYENIGFEEVEINVKTGSCFL